jgi:hypothetical protein
MSKRQSVVPVNLNGHMSIERVVVVVGDPAKLDGQKGGSSCRLIR